MVCGLHINRSKTLTNIKENEMGLDMYARSAPAEMVGDAQFGQELNSKLLGEDGDYKPEVDTDFGYWRKFNHLHGWMEDLYTHKGGTEDFNCMPVRLTKQDLDKLAFDAQVGLEPRAGFFFGQMYDFTEDDRDEVLKFVVKARQAIEDGQAVIYSSWW
jgi:hypothetical protein